MARPLTKEQIISNIFYDLELGFGLIQEALKKAKTQDPTITRIDGTNFMSKQPNIITQETDRGSNSDTASFARFEYQIDIMDMFRSHIVRAKRFLLNLFP